MKKKYSFVVNILLFLVLALYFPGCGFFGDSGGAVTNTYYANCNSDINIVCTGVTVVSGQTIYAGTAGCGLSVSTNSGASFQTFTSANCGLADDIINGVYASGSNIYVATQPFNQNGGLSVSSNGGANWTNYTTATSGFGSNTVYGVYASGGVIYAATAGGLSVFNAGTWTNYTTAQGLGSNTVYGVYSDGTYIYAATAGGLSIAPISTHFWTNYTTGLGSYLGSYAVYGVYVSGGNIYAATVGGLSISPVPTSPGPPLTGVSFTNYAEPLDGVTMSGGNYLTGVYVGTDIYAATYLKGLSYSPLPPTAASWNNITTATSGFGSNTVNGVYASGTDVYAATAGGLSISVNSGATWSNIPDSGLGNTWLYCVYAQ